MRIFLIITLFCSNTITAYAQSNLSLVNLDSVKVETDDHASLVDIKLSAKPDWNRIELEDHGSFLQLSLPNVTVPKPGEFVQGKGPIFPKIGLLQPKTNLSSIRLFANTEAAKIKNNSTVDVLDNRIIVRTEHRGLVDSTKESGSAVDKDSLAATQSPSAEKIENAKDESYVDAFKKIKSELGVQTAQQESVETKTQDKENLASMDDLLQEKLKIAAIVSAILFMITMLIRFLTPKIRAYKNQNSKMPSMEKNPKAIEILSTTSINAKNKLQVIKIGQQSFLLNISLDQVNLLTELDAGSKRVSETNPMLTAAAGVQARESIKLKASTTTMALPGGKEGGSTTALPRVVTGATSTASKPTIQSQEQAFERARAIAQNLKSQSSKPAATAGKKIANKTNRINVAISDEGVIQRATDVGGNKADAAKDVTRLIREKLSKLKDLET